MKTLKEKFAAAGYKAATREGVSTTPADAVPGPPPTPELPTPSLSVTLTPDAPPATDAPAPMPPADDEIPAGKLGKRKKH